VKAIGARHVSKTRVMRYRLLKDNPLGFLRLLTNRHVMGEEVLSPSDAWRAYRTLRADRRIGYLSEPAELEESWDMFMPKVTNSPNLWTDAYLCACCYFAKFTLVTFRLENFCGSSCRSSKARCRIAACNSEQSRA
jgi:hypothetical protein